ncbi:MAG: hypothetical protein D6714_05340 [Bacteroidetes bacterium]|nr:MAG: hypothetical protein D6714_05340 [Bacteroidota bacterium]
MCLFFFGFLCFSAPVFSQKYSNEFLTNGVSARAQGMGNAVIASVSDVTSGYWNPAGLASFSPEMGLQLGAMHAEWFAGVGKFDYLGATIPLAARNRRIGFSMIRFGIDGIPNTLSLYDDDGSVNFDNVVEFSAADYAFLLSYAQKLKTKNENRRLQVGGNVKVIRRVIGQFANSWGFGVDLGAQWHFPKLKLGIVGRDLTSTFNAWNVTFTESEKEVLTATGNDLPDINSVEVTRPSFMLGGAWAMQFDKISFSPELNILLTTDGKRNTLVKGDPVSLDPSLGFEIGYNDFVFFRAGVNQFQRELAFDNSETLTARPSLGVGLVLGQLKVDYAYVDVADAENRFSHVVSLVLNLKPRSGE